MVPVSNFCLERWTPPATVERHSRHQIPCTTIFEIDCDDVSLLLPSDHLFPQTIQVWRRKHGTQCGDVIPVRHFGFLLRLLILKSQILTWARLCTNGGRNEIPRGRMEKKNIKM